VVVALARPTPCAGSAASLGQYQERCATPNVFAAAWCADGGRSGSPSDFFSTVAHELRTPVTALAMSSELLLEDLEELDQRQLRAMVSVIHHGAFWLQGLLENLLAAGAIGAGHLGLRRQPIRLSDIVAEIQPVIGPLLARKRQELRLSLQEDTEVWVDPRRFGQVLVNLLSNASKFSDAGTTISVRSTSTPDVVRFTVADRGPGLPLGRSARLFEPFHRAAEAEQGGHEGIGLGLAIVKSIVEAHGGQVHARNRAGGGASFSITLPALRAEPPRCLQLRMTEEER
jgi:two-component system, OmpR family, sensor histidine kinase KdpD